MTGFERVTIEQEFTRMMIEALKSNPSLSESIDNASKMGYAISFSFINGMCYTTLESKKEARSKKKGNGSIRKAKRGRDESLPCKIRRNPNGRTQGYQIYRNKDFQEG